MRTPPVVETVTVPDWDVYPSGDLALAPDDRVPYEVRAKILDRLLEGQ